MLEVIAMLTILAGMGFYFVKSTDIPKDMREKSAHMRATYGDSSTSIAPKRYAFEKKTQSLSVTELKNKDDASKIEEIQKHVKRQSLIALQNKKIDELTMLITSLEQEIKENNSRNSEIQAEINTHLEALRQLKLNTIA